MEDNTKDKPDLVKDKECINCNRLFDCKGKMRGVTHCINFEQYKEDKFGGVGNGVI